MSLELKVYDNGDHTCLVWLPIDGQPIAGCRGFTIARTSKGQVTYLHGFVGFSDTDKLDPANPASFPLQRFLWWDYSVKPGDTVQYQVIPVVGPNQSKLSLDTKNASPITPPMTITGQCTPHLSAYFNKGIVAAQWVSRALNNTPSKAAITPLVQKPGTPMRNALSGLLRPEILGLLSDTLKNKGQIYAALYELNDQELIPALEAFGKNCNLILANGAFKPPTNDENATVRAELKPKVSVTDRMVSTGHFGHNKFVVFCDSDGKPQQVLTGSTNWTYSGLCTQANNGLIIDDPDVAQDFLDAWHRLKAAGNGYPSSLIQGNSTAKTYTVDGCTITPWFAATSAAQDLDYARKLIDAAQDGILFLFFNPGTFQQDPEKWTLLQNILERHNSANPDFNPNLYMRGVVNQTIAGLTPGTTPAKGSKQSNPVHDPTAPAPVTLFRGGGDTPPIPLGQSVLVPRNIKTQFHTWEQELLGASMVNIHSKVIVLDPFGQHPVVMTGSHNLGYKASHANDDNLVIVEGNAPLAAAYAINIIAIYQTYRWNSYVEAHRNDPKVWHGLVDNDTWQAPYLTGAELAETKFWLGDGAVGAAAPTKALAVAAGAAPAPAAETAPAPIVSPAPNPIHAAHVKSSHRAVAKKAVKKVVKKAATKHAKSAPAAKKKAPAKEKAPAAKKKAAAKHYSKKSSKKK
jgi:phosphatidylserine/phosphatidylglycerophosphate/cardiolipin synthase-like enzyme